jgi:hypothetical protein
LCFYEIAIADELFRLMARERQAVAAAVLDGFGGVEGLFVALWRSNKRPSDDRTADDDDEDANAWRTIPVENLKTAEAREVLSTANFSVFGTFRGDRPSSVR